MAQLCLFLNPRSCYLPAGRRVTKYNRKLQLPFNIDGAISKYRTAGFICMVHHVDIVCSVFPEVSYGLFFLKSSLSNIYWIIHFRNLFVL